MAFSVQDFHDLVRLLAERPEWRAQLRPLILTEELLALPAIVQRLAEAQERTEGRLERLEAAVARLTEAQERTEGRLERLEAAVARLAEAQERTEGRLDRLEAAVTALLEAQERTERRLERLEAAVVALTEAQQRTEQHVRALAEAQLRSEGRLDRLEQHMAELRGNDRERRYRERASGFFGRLLRGVRVVDSPELDRLLDEGRDTGALDEDAIDDVRLADIIVGGQRPGEDSDTFLIVEVSVALDSDDVERAARRAAALGRLQPTLAVVAGDRISDEAARLAKARGVWQMVVGRPVEPGSAA